MRPFGVRVAGEKVKLLDIVGRKGYASRRLRLSHEEI
jgi:hypothetical protein